MLTDLRYELKKIRCSIRHIARLHTVIFLLPFTLLAYLFVDAYLLARVMLRVFVADALRARSWFQRACSWDPQTTTLDLHCISWMLRTSLDKAIHLLTLRLLATMTTLASLDPVLVSACLDIFTGCVSTIHGKVVIPQGSEELAALSALCCLRTLSHLMTVDPASSIFKDMRRRYAKAFPIETDFEVIPSYHRFGIIHNVFYPSRKPVDHQTYYGAVRRPKIRWGDYKPSSLEHVVLVQIAWFKYQREQCRKVPRWILRYVHHLLSQDSLPPASVVADCLWVIAMDLDGTVSNTTISGRRYVHIQRMSTLLTENQCAGGGPFKPDN